MHFSNSDLSNIYLNLNIMTILSSMCCFLVSLESCLFIVKCLTIVYSYIKNSRKIDQIISFRKKSEYRKIFNMVLCTFYNFYNLSIEIPTFMCEQKNQIDIGGGHRNDADGLVLKSLSRRTRGPGLSACRSVGRSVGQSVGPCRPWGRWQVARRTSVREIHQRAVTGRPSKSFREHAKTKYNTIECSYDNNNIIIYNTVFPCSGFYMNTRIYECSIRAVGII